MITGTLKQTAFKFDKELILLMKARAKSLGKSVNRYVTGLVEKDLAESGILPKVDISLLDVSEIDSMCGILSEPDIETLNNDPRALAIWER